MHRFTSLLFLSLLALQCSAVPITSFITHGVTVADTLLPRGQTTTSTLVQLRSSIRFNNTDINTISVSSNGVLSLGQAFNSEPSAFPTDKSLIAPFWTSYNYSQTGQVYYRESNNSDDLAEANSALTGETVTSVVVVTWSEMLGIGAVNQTNTFQCVLATTAGLETYVITNYLTGGMHWAGSPFAQVGVNSGARIAALPLSGTEEVLEITTSGSAQVEGRWLWQVDSRMETIGRIVGWNQSVYTVSEDEGTVQVCLSLLNGDRQGIPTLSSETQAGTAEVSNDYTHTNQLWAFSTTSESTLCMDVPINDDSVLEDEEEFTVSLELTTNVAMLPRFTTIRIQDNERVTVTHSNPTMSVTENAGTIVVCGALRDNEGSTVTTEKKLRVAYSTRPGTAIANEDYVPVLNGELQFVRGASQMCARITIEDDRVFENDEMFYFNFSPMVSQERVTVDSETMGTITIRDNDANAVVLSYDASSYTVNEGDNVTACVSVTGQLRGSFDVLLKTRRPFELIQGTTFPAFADSDYTAQRRMWSVNPSNVRETRCLTVQTIDDVLYEGEEIFGFGLSSDTPVTFRRSRATVFVRDNDQIQISLIQQHFDFREGQDSSTIQICTNRTGEIQRGIVISVAPRLDTASFYNPTDRTGDVLRDIDDIIFFPTDVEACTSVTIVDDYRFEDEIELFDVWLSHPDTEFVLFPVDSATVAIHDNDEVIVRFLNADQTMLSVDENRASSVPRVCISRTGLLDVPVHVFLNPINGTATEHEDYEAEGESLVFPPFAGNINTDVVCSSISLTLLDDPVVEGDEDVLLQLMSQEPERIIVTDAQGVPQHATLTIRENDEVYISFTRQVQSVSEGDGGINVCLTMRGYSTRPFTVSVSTQENTAREYVDFVPQTITIEFPPTNETLLSALYSMDPSSRLNAPLPTSDPQCARVSIIDDQVLENVGSKLLLLNLAEDSIYIDLEDPTSAIITIQDDDSVTVDFETTTMTVSEDVGTARVCARLNGMADFVIDAELRASPSSAAALLDYSTRTASLQFPALSTGLQCADFAIVDDRILEDREEFLVELSILTPNTLVMAGANTTLTVVITDNDFVEVEFVASEFSREEGHRSVEVCAQLVGRSDREVSAVFSTRNSQEGPLATEGVDYTAVSNVTFFGGEISQESLRMECISINLTDDEILEDTESFQVVLTSDDSSVHTTPQSVANVYVLDNDGVRMGIMKRNYEIVETQETLSVCVELIGRIEKSIRADVSTSSLTATGNEDYGTRSLKLEFRASQASNQTRCIDFSIMDDTIYESAETFAVLLAADDTTTGVSIHIPKATVSIVDNDSVDVGFESSSYEVSEGEGQVDVCLVMTGRTETEVECTIDTQSATATLNEEDGPADYIFGDSVSFVFPPSSGTSRQCTSVSLVDDQILESTEQFLLVAASDGPRVSFSSNTTAVSIFDDDSVTVGFVALSFNISEDLESERNVTLCVELSGELEKNVSVTVSTASSDSPLAVATAGHDYVPLEEVLVYSPDLVNKTLCVVVEVLDDRLVEATEQFDIVITSSTPGVRIPEDTGKATVSISDEDVVCESSSTDTARGFFEWQEAFPNEVMAQPCVNGTALRRCSSEGVWGPPEVEDCFATIDAIFKHIFKNLPTDDGLSKDYLRELIKALRRLKEDDPEGLSRFIGPIYTIFEDYAANVTNDVVQVDPEVYELLLIIVDILHYPEWPKYIIQEESVRLVKSVEMITVGLFKRDDFERLKLSNTFLGFSVEKGTVDNLLLGDDQDIKTVTFVKSAADEIVSRLSPMSIGEDTFLSSISLPDSIAEKLSEDNVGLYFAFYETSVLFPIANSTDGTVNQTTHAISPVIMATVSKTDIRDLKDTVNYTISLSGRKYLSPVCVSWDFTAVGGGGNWSTEGCKLVSDEDDVVTCSCTHLTNFAVMLDMRPVPPSPPAEVRPRDSILSAILIVGVGISLLGLALTVVTLLLFSNLRKRDSTILRIQFCISLALMLLAFVCGIERVELFELCVTISALIHYFTLVSMMWMAAEALLMFQKLIMVSKTSVAYFVIASIICWLLPVPAVVVPIGIDRNFSIHENYCFISHHVVFYAAFLGPIAAILIFNLIIFFLAFIVILKYSSQQYNKTEKAKKRRAAVRTIFAILTVMVIFGLTWVFGAFTVLSAPDYFEYLFVIFNSFQGLFIFLIYVVFAKETRDLWLQTCGCKKRKGKGITEGTSRRVSRNPSLRKTDDDYDSEIDYSLDGDRLEALEAMDKDKRLNMNSWDVMYIMPQNTFDIFLDSDQFQQPPSLPMAPAPVPARSRHQASSPTASASGSSKPHTPTADIVREDQSTADSGIMMDQSKAIRSPRRIIGEPITTLEVSDTKNSSYHVHSVSGIGYVSADSDDEFLDQASPPILATPPSKRRSRAYGDRFKLEMQTCVGTHEHDPELGVVTSDFKIDVAQ